MYTKDMQIFTITQVVAFLLPRLVEFRFLLGRINLILTLRILENV